MLLAFATMERKGLMMTVRTECRGAAAAPGACSAQNIGARQSSRSCSASFSKPWLSVADHKPVPQYDSAMDCGGPTRDVRLRRAVLLPGGKLTIQIAREERDAPVRHIHC
jgi:hypothetical protein